MIRDPEAFDPTASAFDASPVGTMRAGHDGVVHLQDNVPLVVVKEGGPALGPAMRFTGKRND